MAIPNKQVWQKYTLLLAIFAIPFMALAEPDKEYTGAKPREESDSIGLRFRGGIGSADYTTCKEGFGENVFKGGKGESHYSTCPYDLAANIYKGGEGQAAYTSCPDDFSSMVYRGGEGHAFYTTCPDNLFSMISLGGEGQSFYTSCPDNFSDMISRGGEGQAFYTTCPDNFFGVISRGGEGQTFYTTCPDNFFSFVTRGGIGQTFYTNCVDITSLFVYKTNEQTKWCLNQQGNFKITVTNKDYAIFDLSNIVVRDSLGAGFTPASWTATVGTYNPITGEWLIPSLARGETEELTLTASAGTKGQLTNFAWIKNASDKRAAAKDTAKVFVDILEGIGKRGDIRAQVYPEPYRDINVNNWLDTIFTSAVWNVIEGPAIAADGKINSNKFTSGIYSYIVRVEDECLTTDIKAYLSVLADNNAVVNKDVKTVEVCKDQHAVINMNSLLGIEANGTWTLTPLAASAHLATSSLNAKVFNTKDAFDNPAIPFFNHKGGTNNAKQITFLYKVNSPGNHLHNKVFTVNLIITDNLL